MRTRSPQRAHLAAALAIIALSAIFRLWYSAQHELLQDEAYYWNWSRHLAAGYYDNTPAVAFIIRLGTMLFGNTEIGVRVGAVTCAAIAAVFVYLLASEMFGAAVGLVAVVIATVVPLFGAGAFMMTSDPPQALFWTVTAWAAWRAFQSGGSGRASWGWWLLAGAAAGLTAMAKLNGLLLLPSVLLYAAIDPRARAWLRRPHPYVAAAIALAVFAPFVWWNHAHGNAFWLHIDAMGSRTDKSSGHFTLKYLGDYLGSQAGLISPLLFMSYLWTLYASPRKQESSAILYCWSLTVVVFAATLLLSLKSRVEGNWAIASYLTGFILIAFYAVSSAASYRLRLWHATSLILATALTAMLYASTFPGGPRLRPLEKRTNELYGWRQMAARVQSERQAMGGAPFVFGINYRMPSELAFYLPGQPQTDSLFLRDRANEYMFWKNAKSLVGRDAVMVNDVDSPDHLDDCRAVFQRVEVEPAFYAFRPGIAKPIRTVQIFRCYGFKGYRREDWQVGW